MAEPVVIEHEGKPTHVVVPYADWERIMDDLDAAHARRVISDPTTEWVPADVAWRIADGEVPIKVWREHRKLTQKALADRVGVDQSLVARWERRANMPRLPELRRLCDALRVSADALID
jgi:DNA-binding transcriptional regulator YiaG